MRHLQILTALVLGLNASAFADGFDAETMAPRHSSDPYGYSVPGNPSPGHDGYNSYHQQLEQMERYRHDSLETERFREREEAAAAAGSRLYTPPSVITTPTGKAMTCLPPTKGNPLTTCF